MHNITILYITVFIFSFLLSISLVYVLKSAAVKLDLIDRPGERKIHSVPTPLHGGAVIFLSVYITVFVFFLLQQIGLPSVVSHHIPGYIEEHFHSIGPNYPKIFIYFFGGIVIFIIGILDDKRELSPSVRLTGETIIAVCVVVFGLKPGFFETLHVLGLLLAVGWIVGITNGFNLIDGVNGLCAGNALVSSLIFLTVAARGGSFLVGTLLVIFIGAIAGFFIFNFPKGKLFLGSSGSMFIGYTLSVLVMFQSYGTDYYGNFRNYLPIIMPALILAVPLIDTLLVMYRRLTQKKSFFEADTNHLHHRLRRLRMKDKEVVIIMLLISFAIGINATLLYKSTVGEALTVLLQAAAIFIILTMLTRLRERRTDLRKTTTGKVKAYLKNESYSPFNGFIIDISRQGLSFCLLNLDKHHLENNVFTGKEMELEFVPPKTTYKIEPPFQKITGKVIKQEIVADSALRIGFVFHEPLKEQ